MPALPAMLIITEQKLYWETISSSQSLRLEAFDPMLFFCYFYRVFLILTALLLQACSLGAGPSIFSL